jgi:hypothetical protein
VSMANMSPLMSGFPLHGQIPYNGVTMYLNQAGCRRNSLQQFSSRYLNSCLFIRCLMPEMRAAGHLDAPTETSAFARSLGSLSPGAGCVR